ncbi:ThiF family adenylyltransferase [Rhodanobacter sp. DHG33]|uniref:HesA/MoeB/ThiF family protein n=1 Tax=Rhodanobacter sp. DHG33 TaxID=2775921 RepID=UPI001782E218|nr:ThiF family adenylyltransferase [Rhodanobacter sp. DHG33]MBD8900360.1 ThiF family adenylyltransferase [Rhodanobacter sp. DHG33]
MNEITLSESHFELMQRALFQDGSTERCVIFFASQAEKHDGSVRLLVREMLIPDDDDYSLRDTTEAELVPAVVARVSKKAKTEQLSLIFVHSHPGEAFPHFSTTDDAGEAHMATFLAHRTPGRLHAALVVSKGGLRARVLGAGEGIRVIGLGTQRTVLFDPIRDHRAMNAQFDRQVRAFGTQGQHAIEALCVGIVGLGGTGSLLVEQLMHLGVKKFILIDPDVIELSNLNRVVGANHGDLGVNKAKVAARGIRTFAPDSHITVVEGDITHERHARALFDADFLFGCTDSHGSRAVLQQIAYQYLLPCIDMGSTITASRGEVTGIFGRVQLLTPGQACLTCSSLLDPEQVRRDMMSEAERTLDPYIVGAHEPAPAVISINGTVVSLATTMFMAVVAGIPSDGRYLLYNGKNSSLRRLHAAAHPNCYICSYRGTYARGDALRLYARGD